MTPKLPNLSVKLGIVLSLVLTILIATNIAFLYSQSIRLDESQSIWAATRTIPGLLKYTAEDVHVPLYNILLHFWLYTWGNSVVAARTLSLIFFLLCLPSLYLLAREHTQKKVALLTVGLFGLSPFIIWYSTESRMYTLFALVTIYSHLFFLRLFASLGKKSKLPFLLVTIFGLYTHYFYLLVIFSQGLFTLTHFLLQIANLNQEMQVSFWQAVNRSKNLLLIYSGLVFLAGSTFIPWLSYVVSLGLASNTRPHILPPSSYNLLQIFVNFVFGFQSQIIQGIIISSWPMLIILMFFIFTKSQKSTINALDYFLCLTFVPIALGFIISYLQPVFLARYLILITPSLFLILAWLLLSYNKKISTFLAVFTLTIISCLLILQTTSFDTPVKEDYQGVTNYLEKAATPSDVIVITAPFTIYPIDYTYNGTTKLTTIPIWNRFSTTNNTIPAFSDQDLDKQIKTYQTQYQRIYLVVSYDQGYQKDIVGYLDNHYKLAEIKYFSSDIQIRVYNLQI